MEDTMLPADKQVSDRRSFLGSIAAGSAAIAITGVGLHGAATEASAEDANPVGYSEAWLSKLTGKHKQFFDATSTNQFPLVFAMNFLNSYNDAYKIPDANLSAVVGLRHFAIATALTDDIWSRYKVAEFVQAMDPATPAAAKAEWMAGLLPGVTLVPSGVLAVNRAQEKGCTYCSGG
jgi:hypothetical protein